ncbi:outer membrane beta-barrel protein [uncultured Stenotrophomonas sp.]|uniref:outer membrane beta-barrel protein n=1 Tax=uncultured Stenotrophomonas sp. TaxID=165438 RepID=UPI0025F1A200|nr:outer membrane beta-barrel protein [uncultured Stenotrophomonas sp.]
MKKNSLAALVPLLLLTAGAADAQSISEGWTAYRAQQTAPAAARPAQPPVAGETTPQVTSASPVAPTPAAAPAPQWGGPSSKREQPQSGFFVGVQGGAGWVYEDADQRAVSASAGYRWQIEDFAQVGIELGAGKLRQTHDKDFLVPEVRFTNIGANARFSFGRNSAWFGTVRAGYWRAKSDDYWGKVSTDGLYGGVGVGVDVSRHFNLQLMYTGYLYSADYNYNDEEYEVNGADTLTLGAEVRF